MERDSIWTLKSLNIRSFLSPYVTNSLGTKIYHWNDRQLNTWSHIGIMALIWPTICMCKLKYILSSITAFLYNVYPIQFVILQLQVN